MANRKIHALLFSVYCLSSCVNTKFATYIRAEIILGLHDISLGPAISAFLAVSESVAIVCYASIAS